MMEKYIVQYGQSIYDVALSIYGSIEGLLDLMVCNPQLSIDSEIKYGDVLYYTPYYTEDSTVVTFYKQENHIPSNGIGHIYYKNMEGMVILFSAKNTVNNIYIDVSGEGSIYIDWGDNEDIMEYKLSSTLQSIHHHYTTQIASDRIVKIYGSKVFYDLDISDAKLTNFFLVDNVNIENLIIDNAGFIDLSTIGLSKDSLNMSFNGTNLKNINTLLGHKSLYNLDLSNCGLNQEEVDEFLIGLVKNYGIRPACTINLSENQAPSGLYQEPIDIRNPETGMEAIYVMVHYHKESNGSWAFIINSQDKYTL